MPDKYIEEELRNELAILENERQKGILGGRS